MRTLVLLLVLAFVRTGLGDDPPGRVAFRDASGAKDEGAALAKEILSQKPADDLVQTGTLQIRDADGHTTTWHIRFSATVTPTNWTSVFVATTGTNGGLQLNVLHAPEQICRYRFGPAAAVEGSAPTLAGVAPAEVMGLAFGGSDFSFGDLGLEFFHWPEQQLVKKEMRRGRFCRVLESVNPQPATNGYSRVVSWIDRETRGIVFAEAYDAQGRRLKEFSPKEFKRVNGQWQLQRMEIRNLQTGSRSRIEFDPAPAP